MAAICTTPEPTVEKTRSDSVPKPNFLYIGMPKAGSTWIFEMLRQHPDVYVPAAKDIKYFDDNYHRGEEWYLKFFRGANGAKAVGELSHDYYAVPEAAARIHRDLPDVKLICCLREPGDFAASAFRYARIHSLEETLEFGAYAQHLMQGTYLSYLKNLRRFFERFPADNIKIVFYDDLRNAPDSFLSALYDFIGVSNDFRPAGRENRVNATRSPRWIVLTRLAYTVARMFRAAGLANLVGSLKSNPQLQRFLYKDASESAPIDRSKLAELRLRCRREFETLEALIGKPLPRTWYDAE